MDVKTFNAASELIDGITALSYVIDSIAIGETRGAKFTKNLAKAVRLNKESFLAWAIETRDQREDEFDALVCAAPTDNEK